MELILKTNNETSLAKIIALAKKLNVAIVQQAVVNEDKSKKQELKDRILNFKAISASSFGDAADWQNKERNDRDLPF